MKRLAIALLSLIAASAASARVEFGQDLVGDSDGDAFVVRCPLGSNLVGVDIYSRDDIDAIQPVCATAYSATELGAVEAVGAPVGGRADGANHTRLLCAGATPVVTGAYIAAEIHATSGVNNIHLFCGVAGINATPATAPLVRFDGPAYTVPFHGEDARTQHCQQNLVGVGLRGSASGWVHSLALICGEPGFTARKVGRSKLDPKGKTAAGITPGIGATDFCERYANAAVTAALDNRSLGCGQDGGRWTTDFSRHFDWCVSQRGDRSVADAEAAARADALAQCRGANE